MGIDTLNIILLAILGSVIALIGGVIFLYKESWSNLLSAYSTPFAAGVLLTVALISLLPESVHMSGDQVYLIVLLTFLSSYLFENVFFSLHHHDERYQGHNSIRKSIPLVIMGDTVHNFIDGVAIASSYLVNPGLGLIAAISTLLHEIPHEIGDFGILLQSGWSRRKTFVVNLISSLATIFGALLVIYVVDSLNVIGYLMAVAAGLFLYLGASDFLPHIHDGEISQRKAIASLLIGSSLMLVVASLVPHGHESESTNVIDVPSRELVKHQD